MLTKKTLSENKLPEYFALIDIETEKTQDIESDTAINDPTFDSVWTIPNAICAFRLAGSLALIIIAFLGMRNSFVGFYLVLMLSDFVDGKLARWMKQRSDLGARLDSYADALLTVCLLIGVAILAWEPLLNELPWIATGLLAYAANSAYSIWKFRRMPSYHSYAAKTTQLLTLIAAITFVLQWSPWPLRVATIALFLTNLEGIAMTRVLPKWQADVPSFFHALALSKDVRQEH